MTTLAWHNNPTLKTEVVERLRAHRAEDSIVKGLYQEVHPDLATGYKGCAIGCTLPRLDNEPASWHQRVEELYGIPRQVARLIDGIFENLPTDQDQHARFAVEVIDAVPVGADLTLVTARLMLDLLSDAEHGVVQHTKAESRQRAAVDAVIALYQRKLAGEEITTKEWRAAYTATYAADADTYAAYAAAYTAAYAAADAADAADADAYAAAYAADADAAGRNTNRSWQAARLIHHLTTAPILATAGTDGVTPASRTANPIATCVPSTLRIAGAEAIGSAAAPTATTGCIGTPAQTGSSRSMVRGIGC